ncbi:aldehyde dehydrogenase, partial [Streptomyces sp. AV19]|nr:aldehyde dehydrogenase [Streptomyces sp. AV19]
MTTVVSRNPADPREVVVSTAAAGAAATARAVDGARTAQAAWATGGAGPRFPAGGKAAAQVA